MTRRPATALVAEDEPLLRGSLVRLLAAAWPELEVLDQVRSGREAVDAFGARHHDQHSSASWFWLGCARFDPGYHKRISAYISRIEIFK